MFHFSRCKRPHLSFWAFPLTLIAMVTCGASAAVAATAEEKSSDELRSASPEGAPEIRAQLTPRQYTTLSSELAGRIDRINTKLGEHFKKGDNLITFDCVIQRAQVAHAQ